MPEILEIELYRRAAQPAIGRPVTAVLAPDDWYLKRTDAVSVAAVCVGHEIADVRRHGKLLLADLSSGPTLGLRFGMTGRLLVDGGAIIEQLEYSSGRNDPAWDRFGLDFADGGELRMRDPRRLGGVEIDPDITKLGPDAWLVTATELGEVLGRSRSALKARLLDQSALAGLGNLLTDEILWRSGFAPGRASNDLTADDVAALWSTMRSTLDELDARGGSHTGDLQEERSASGRCPSDGGELRRERIGGRTTIWCPDHQQ